MVRWLILILAVLLNGCASLPAVSSFPETASGQEERFFYDESSGIRYSVSNDDERFILRFTVPDENMIREMLRKGVYVYLDPSGKKKKDIYVNYPLKREGAQKRPDMLMPAGKPGSFDEAKRPEFKLGEQLESLPTEALFCSYGLMEIMPVYSGRSSVKVSLRAIDDRQLAYELIIPFKRISDKPAGEIETVTVGILSGKTDMIQMSGGPGEGPGGGGMQGGMHGGDLPSGDRMQGGEFGGNRDNVVSNPVELWFKVNLYRGE